MEGLFSWPGNGFFLPASRLVSPGLARLRPATPIGSLAEPSGGEKAIDQSCYLNKKSEETTNKLERMGIKMFHGIA